MNEDKFLKDLSKLVKKYNLSNCVFAGENEDGKMVGFYCIEKVGQQTTAKDFIECCLNVTRMYQSAREKIFYTLDKYIK